jgi:acetyl-CoA synthetase
MKEGRDQWLQPLLDQASDNNVAEIMDAEDPLFILTLPVLPENQKEWYTLQQGYMVYSAYTFKNVFNYEDNDIFWCTADIGWITGHSYILYGPLLNGATTVIFEGVPSYPDFSRFWQTIEKHKVTQFYTAPTAIRALAKKHRIRTTLPIDFESDWISGRTHQ